MVELRVNPGCKGCPPFVIIGVSSSNDNGWTHAAIHLRTTPEDLRRTADRLESAYAQAEIEEADSGTN